MEIYNQDDFEKELALNPSAKPKYYPSLCIVDLDTIESIYKIASKGCCKMCFRSGTSMIITLPYEQVRQVWTGSGQVTATEPKTGPGSSITDEDINRLIKGEDS